MNIFKAIATGIIKCNSLLVRHNLEIGEYTAFVKKVADLRSTDTVLVLEKIGGEDNDGNNGKR